MSQHLGCLSHLTPQAVVGLSLGKAEVQGSNPCNGTTTRPLNMLLFCSFRGRIVRKALEQVAATGPKESTPESRAEVARMAQEAASALKASSSRAMPHAPVPAKPDAPMTPLARELVAAGMKNVAQPVTKDDPGVVL